MFRVRVKARFEIAFGHAPPLQEFDEVPMRSVRYRIQSFEHILIYAR